ncbi:MAG: hypothetical protein LIP04_07085 [Tannerellaceae bacterium]|nr:hypothetical protein [Tannerellaceae bacterium]
MEKHEVRVLARYEAENATLGGDATIENSVAGYSGTGYVNINNTGTITFDVTMEEAGFYSIQIGYNGMFGEKRQNLSVNGTGLGEVAFPETTEFTQIEGAKKVRLNAGSNTVTISSSWGWMLVDYIQIEDYVEIPFNIDPELVNPNASDEAKNLYEFLKENFQKKVISGVMTLDSMVEPEWLYENTGKYPAILGLDFMHNVGKDTEWFVNDPNRVHQVADDAEEYYNRNGIPVICWHWRDPSKQTSAFYTEDTNFDINVIYDTTSDGYKEIISDIDVIAAELKRLTDKHVPVLWRPLHEAAGGWFWWGAKGPQPLKDLWHILYERLVNYHGLNNLVWIWTADADDAAINWYPGHDYVDLVGIDIYPPAGDHNSQVTAFEKLKEIFEGRKILALSECGSIPDPDEMIADGALWSYFMPWYGEHTIPGEGTPHNSVEFWKKIMHHELVITLDEMPAHP